MDDNPIRCPDPAVTVRVPGSKSLSQRALVAATLAQGDSMISNLLVSEDTLYTVSYTHLRAHETVLELVCRLLLEKKKQTTITNHYKQELTRQNQV